VTWHSSRLADVCELNPRRPRIERDDDTLTSFVSMSAVAEEGLGIVGARLRPYAELRKGYTWFLEGDVLFAKITPCMQNAKHAVARDMRDGIGFGSTEFHVLRAKPGTVAPEWIHYFVLQPRVLNGAESFFSGSVGQQRVPESYLAGLEIPLPPLDEQLRIIASVRERLAAVERARQAAKERVEAARGLEGSLARAVFLGGEATSWPQKPLGELTRLVSGGTPPRGEPALFRGFIPWVKTLDLNGREVLDTEEKITQEAFETIRGELLPVGTVMVAMYGGKGTIGKSGILGIQACTNQAVCSILPNEPEFVGRFLLYWLNAIRPHWMKFSGGNRRDPNINKAIVAQMPAPAPPIAVQVEAVRYLDAGLGSVAATRASAKAELSAIEALPAALLRKAFEGGA